jgi:hypothetical protein
MLGAASDPGLLATDLADYLVKRGVPFRQAHETIGKLVAFSIQHHRPFTELTLLEYRQFSDHFDEDVFAVLNLDNALRGRTAVGAPSPKNVASLGKPNAFPESSPRSSSREGRDRRGDDHPGLDYCSKKEGSGHLSDHRAWPVRPYSPSQDTGAEMVMGIPGRTG